VVLQELGDLQSARERLQSAPWRSSSVVYGPDHPEFTRAGTNLRNVLRDLGDSQPAPER
jgi:hypothetical protein